MNTLLNSTCTGVRRSPFFASTDLSEIFDALSAGAQATAAPSMPIDVVEREDGITVLANVPGFTRDDVAVEFHEGVLTIAASRGNTTTPAAAAKADCCGPSCCTGAQADAAKQSKPARTVVRERPMSNVRRAISMPDRVTGEGITAELADGVLTVTLPYAARPTPKKISVN